MIANDKILYIQQLLPQIIRSAVETDNIIQLENIDDNKETLIILSKSTLKELIEGSRELDEESYRVNPTTLEVTKE